MSLNAFGLARLGRDAELQSTPAGGSYTRLSLAFDNRVKNEKVTQWVDAVLFGKRAESLVQYLTKGQTVFVTVENTRIEEFVTNDGVTKNKLSGVVLSIELAPSGQKPASAPPPPPPARAPAPAPRPAAAAPSGYDDMDLDIPFVSDAMAFDMVTGPARRMRKYKF
jgi:single-strand DNA-binding protein